MEINKRTRWWRPEDDEKATSGIPDCPRVLPIGGRFCCRGLMPGDLASKAAAQVMKHRGAKRSAQKYESY